MLEIWDWRWRWQRVISGWQRRSNWWVAAAIYPSQTTIVYTTSPPTATTYWMCAHLNRCRLSREACAKWFLRSFWATFSQMRSSSWFQVASMRSTCVTCSKTVSITGGSSKMHPTSSNCGRSSPVTVSRKKRSSCSSALGRTGLPCSVLSICILIFVLRSSNLARLRRRGTRRRAHVQIYLNCLFSVVPNKATSNWSRLWTRQSTQTRASTQRD